VAVDSQWSQVENQLERQHDLIPKLLTLTRAYAEHERGVFEKLADARSRYLQAPPGQKPSEARSVDMAFAEVLLVAERYPDLKADQQFRDLSYEIAGTQNRIALERKRFNDLVALHNARIRQVPWRLLAVDMEARAFYAPPEGGLSDPKVSL
jgi:LemA protein